MRSKYGNEPCKVVPAAGSAIVGLSVATITGVGGGGGNSVGMDVTVTDGTDVVILVIHV